MSRTYTLTQGKVDSWKLTLFEDGHEAGGGVFQVHDEPPHIGIEWWNSISSQKRAYWLTMAASAVAADARHAFLLAEAYEDATREGESWSSVNGH